MPSESLEGADGGAVPKLAASVSSEMFSINPAPKTGVGMRKLRLPLAASAAKSGCASIQPGASAVSPAIVNRSCTPLSDLKRTSRTGPSALIKGSGVGFWKTMVWPLTVNPWPTVACGLFPTKGKAFALGEVPPVAGCEWHEPQELLLNVGPRPPLPGPADKLTGSTSLNCAFPLLKKLFCCVVRVANGLPGLPDKSGLGPLRGPGSRLARLAARCLSRSKSWAMTPAEARQIERTRNITDTQTTALRFEHLLPRELE